MKRTFTLAGLALALLPTALTTAPAHAAVKKAAPATTYQCQKCHMKVSAAVAKKDHYKDPMDGGKLVPMTKPMGGMKM